MKINNAIATAILAYCVVAAPASVNSTTEKSAALPSEPILHMVSPPGLLQPVSPKKPKATRVEAGNLEEFPEIVEDYHNHENEDEELHRSFLRPFGRGGHGPVMHPRPDHHHDGEKEKGWFHPATGGPLHDSTLAPVNNTRPAPLDNFDADTTPSSDADEIRVSHRSTSNDSGTCFKANAKRSIGHEHDQEHTVIDECDTNIKEENSKQGDTITSHSRTHVGTVHSDRVGESHKDINDGLNKADGIEGLDDLPPQLREHYLDELAKLNATGMNYEISQKHNNSTMTTDTKSNPKDGTTSSETDLHTIDMTVHRVHDEVKVDTKGPVSLEYSEGRNEAQTSSLYLPESSSTSVVEPTPASQSSKAHGTYTFSTAYATTSPTATSAKAPASSFSTITWSNVLPGKASVSSSFVESKSESKRRSTPPTTASVLTLTKTKLLTKTKVASSSSKPTSTAAADDENIPVPDSEIKGSNGEDLEPVRSDRRGDQRVYLASVQKLNTKHMNEVQSCKANMACIKVSNREFAGALADLDYSMS